MINPDDANIIAAVRSVRRLTRDVAKLLTTAREFLEDAGWKSRTTQAISVSTSLNNAENWIPQDAFWFSFNERFPNHLLVVSVVFDSVENPNNLASPLVMAGYVRFAQPVRDNWSFRWSRLCEEPARAAIAGFTGVATIFIALLRIRGKYRGMKGLAIGCGPHRHWKERRNMDALEMRRRTAACHPSEILPAWPGARTGLRKSHTAPNSEVIQRPLIKRRVTVGHGEPV